MTTHHLRHRRMLSMGRRAGLQLDADAAQGRAPRHAQSWREINAHPDDDLDAPRGVFAAIAYSLIAWACVGVSVWIAMAVL